MMKKQAVFWIIFLAFALSVWALSLKSALLNFEEILPAWRWQKYFQNVSDQKSPVVVRRVVDGDTIELENDEMVRYIGVNTPESVDPRRTVECFGKEASAFNKKLVEGKKVILERDVSDRDKYGRLLRFVYLEDGTFINEVLVREGYAFVATYPPDVSRQDLFRSAEKLARDEKKGLWSETACNGKK